MYFVFHRGTADERKAPFRAAYSRVGNIKANLVPRLLSALPVPSCCERTLVLSGHVISQILGYRVICH